MISSVGYSNKEIIKNILDLHIKSNRFDLDPCFSVGKFYKGLLEPTLKFDILPQRDDVLYGNSTNLNLENESINSIMFDPPFLVSWGKSHNYICEKRFGYFPNRKTLREMYKKSIGEFYRVLRFNGYLIVKCQDFTASGSEKATDMNHALIYMWATEVGFWAKDIFILVAKNRIYNPAVKQKTARKFHSYFWVFKKLTN